MEKDAETDLLYSFQQATLDERHWFELYHNLLNYGSQEHTSGAAGELVTLLEETLEFKEQISAQWRLFNHVFDSLPFAILFLDNDYNILHYNRKATALYYQSGFQHFLSQLNPKNVPEPTHNVTIPDNPTFHTLIWQNDFYTYYLTLIPYHDHPQVSSIVYAYQNKPQLNPSTLSQLFMLSDSECRTLQALIEYHSSKEVAEQLNISHETIRTHLKSIMRKTQTHSQSELIMKLFSGSYWLGEIQAFHQFEEKNNKQLIAALIHEPFVLLGKKTKKAHINLVIPSFFGIIWDFIEENASLWQQWCDNNNCQLLIINTHQIIPKVEWKSSNLTQLCQQLATPLQDYLTQHCPYVQSVSILGIHTGAGFALNLPPYLPYKITTIKLISPILPLPYMPCEQIRHSEYHSASKAQKIPKKIWYAIMPHIIDAATKDTQTYFQKRLSYQRYEADKQKVRRWLNHSYLGQIFSNYCQLANHKIAFDVLLLHQNWQIPELTTPVICFAGKQDIYTSLEAIHAWAQDNPNIIVHCLEDEAYTLSLATWQLILSFQSQKIG